MQNRTPRGPNPITVFYKEVGILGGRGRGGGGGRFRVTLPSIDSPNRPQGQNKVHQAGGIAIPQAVEFSYFLFVYFLLFIGYVQSC